MATDAMRDLVLSPNEFGYVLDKGHITVLVGPTKEPLADTDQPVVFDTSSKSFVPTRNLSDVKQKTIVAPEGWYVALKNPAKENIHPRTGIKVTDIPALLVGNKINIPGPVNFALWPMQMAKVIQGHRLAYDEYLLCNVYNADAANQSITDTVIETAVPTKKEEIGQESEGDITLSEEVEEILAEELASEEMQIRYKTGQQFIIRGDKVSFYMPPTGIEVVKNSVGNYVREAVTLESIEYCMLKDENGEKRYVQGPDVVFPSPREEFILDAKKNAIFKAIELNNTSGLYIRVIEDYDLVKKGTELFITGKDQAIYFPRKEHAIIKYGSSMIHHAVAIPLGEARYVLDRDTSAIKKLKGPEMFLPDPRTEVIIRKILSKQEVELMFPNNEKALAYNLHIKEMATESGTVDEGYFSESMSKSGASPLLKMSSPTASDDSYSDEQFDDFFKQKNAPRAGRKQPAGAKFADSMDRKTSFQKPRQITLDSKYDGAVRVEPWNNFAIQIISTSGKREIVEGPTTVLLDYDQTLGSLILSRGRPKGSKLPLKTAYLKIRDNRVTDTIVVETADFCEIELDISYLINFEGDSKKWFNANNYVQLCSDRCRAIIRNVVSKVSIKDFYGNAADIIRDLILGEPSEDGRKGREFSENGMVIYDVEVQRVEIMNAKLQEQMVENTRNLVSSQLELNLKKHELQNLVEIAKLDVQARTLKDEKLDHESKLALADLDRQKEAELKKVEITDSVKKLKLSKEKVNEDTLTEISQIRLDRNVNEFEVQVEQTRQQQELQEALLTLKSNLKVDEVAAIFKPELMASLKALEQSVHVQTITNTLPASYNENLSPIKMIAKLIEGTGYEGVIEKLLPQLENKTSEEMTSE